MKQRASHCPHTRYCIREKAAMDAINGYRFSPEDTVGWLAHLQQGCEELLSTPHRTPEQKMEISGRYDRLVKSFHQLAHCAADAAINHARPDHVDDAYAAIDHAMKEMHEYIGSIPTTQRFLPSREEVAMALPCMHGAMVEAARNAPRSHAYQLYKMRLNEAHQRKGWEL